MPRTDDVDELMSLSPIELNTHTCVCTWTHRFLVENSVLVSSPYPLKAPRLVGEMSDELDLLLNKPKDKLQT